MTTSPRQLHLALALSLLVCAVSFDYLSLSARADSTAGSGRNSDRASINSDPVRLAESLSQGIRDAVELVRPSLVTISPASNAIAVLPPLLPEFSDGDYSPFRDNTRPPSVFRSEASHAEVATGVIVSEDGFIWTSDATVRELDTVMVTLQTNTSYEGKVLLHDQESGLAIIKINAENLPAVNFAPVARRRLADWAIAVALNDRHEPIVSAGLVSSFSEKLGSLSGQKRIHFAFPVPAEGTGCALVNLSGELIGIHAAASSIGDGEIRACTGLAVEAANELQQKVVESAVTVDGELRQQKSSPEDSTTTQCVTWERKEGTFSKFDTIRDLFSVPRSQWTPAMIASSVRSWLTSGREGNSPGKRAVSNQPESH